MGVEKVTLKYSTRSYTQ